ncbi:MAG: hypothetical protein ACE5EL_01145 [Anaerolineae bacterium]
MLHDHYLLQAAEERQRAARHDASRQREIRSARRRFGRGPRRGRWHLMGLILAMVSLALVGAAA